MGINPLLGALAVSSVVFLSIPAWSAGNQPPSPPAVSQPVTDGLNKARQLIGNGRFDEAFTLVRSLAVQHPRHLDVRFHIGLATIGAS